MFDVRLKMSERGGCKIFDVRLKILKDRTSPLTHFQSNIKHPTLILRPGVPIMEVRNLSGQCMDRVAI